MAIAKAYNYKNVLVVAPKSSHYSWSEDNKHFSLNLSIYSYESFRSKVNDISLYDMVIFDEAHRLKNPKAQVSKKAFSLVAYNEIPRLMLSGTPADRFYELYMQIKILDPALLHYKSYSQFINTYYYLNKYFQPERLKRPEYAEQLKQLFSLIMHKVKKDEVLELPPLVDEFIKLPKFKLDIELSSLEQYTVANFIKEYKLSQGIKNDDKIYNTDKLDWLLDFVEDNPNTIAFSLFRAVPLYIKSKYRDKFYIITGDDKKDLTQAITKADKPVIATYSLKEGANLQKYSNIVYLSLPLAYRDYEQSLSRIYRAGQRNKATIYHIQQNKIDFIVYGILKEKKDVFQFLRKEDE
ncbi:MAG: SNF2-related protein [Brevundimonas sp.]